MIQSFENEYVNEEVLNKYKPFGIFIRKYPGNRTYLQVDRTDIALKFVQTKIVDSDDNEIYVKKPYGLPSSFIAYNFLSIAHDFYDYSVCNNVELSQDLLNNVKLFRELIGKQLKTENDLLSKIKNDKIVRELSYDNNLIIVNKYKDFFNMINKSMHPEQEKLVKDATTEFNNISNHIQKEISFT